MPVGAFQADAFQSNAFQAGEVSLVAFDYSLGSPVFATPGRSVRPQHAPNYVGSPVYAACNTVVTLVSVPNYVLGSPVFGAPSAPISRTDGTELHSPSPVLVHRRSASQFLTANAYSLKPDVPTRPRR